MAIKQTGKCIAFWVSIILYIFSVFRPIEGYAQKLLLYGAKDGLMVLDLKTNSIRKINDKIDSVRLSEKAASIVTSGAYTLTGDDTLRCKIYNFLDQKMVVKYCGNMLCEDGSVKWEKGNTIECFQGCDYYSAQNNAVVYFVPTFKKDYSRLLYTNVEGPFFVDRTAIIEIDLKNGETKSIRRKCNAATYSTDGNYILLKAVKAGRYYVYDCFKEETIKSFKDINSACWVE